MAEMPEHYSEDSGGIVKVSTCASQTNVAFTEPVCDLSLMCMEQVVCRANMIHAYNKVLKNKGAAGVDGITTTQLSDHLKQYWPLIKDQLLQGRYIPTEVCKVEIPKPQGGMRMLGIPTVTDRLICQALLQVMQPYFDPIFSDVSYGFRPKRSAHQAVKRAQSYVCEGYRYVVDVDLEKFFDRVNHDILMSKLTRHIKDKRILKLIRRYLQAGMMEGGIISPRIEGCPQGSPLSPLLSNILLDDLDKEMERRGHKYVRYADDFNIYVRSERSGRRVLESVSSYLDKQLRLKVNTKKSAVARPWQRSFLSYSISKDRKSKLMVSHEAQKRFKEKLKAIFRKGRGQNIKRLIKELVPKLRGWINYFRYSELKGVLERLDFWLRRRLRLILWRQWKRPKTRIKRMISLGIDPVRAHKSASNGRGAWWNSGASHMNQAIPTKLLRSWGMISLLENHQRLAKAS